MQDSIMNKTALDEILANCEEYLASCPTEPEDWQSGFAAVIATVEQTGVPIVEACQADYGDAEGPVMNRAALTSIWAVCEGGYDDNAKTGNHNSTWLLGVSAGIQRFEMFAGEIVADCE